MPSLPIARSRSCPSCKSSFVEREARRGLFLRAFCALTGTRPYRCFDCDFFFLAPKGLRSTSPVLSEPPAETSSQDHPRTRAAHG
jgi:hypothetical protein